MHLITNGNGAICLRSPCHGAGLRMSPTDSVAVKVAAAMFVLPGQADIMSGSNLII